MSPRIEPVDITNKQSSPIQRRVLPITDYNRIRGRISVRHKPSSFHVWDLRALTNRPEMKSLVLMQSIPLQIDEPTGIFS
mmetsp:Transcript_38781/g.62136  ORF Transcript_38781/g.62136 Transcript_38781/m.62136 type:complete len:80 (+) Transcript_38781:919-1158(+)